MKHKKFKPKIPKMQKGFNRDSKKYPTLLAFRLEGIWKGLVKAWCPYCKVWHKFKEPTDPKNNFYKKPWIEKKMSDYWTDWLACDKNPLKKSGYYLKIASKASMRNTIFDNFKERKIKIKKKYP